MSRAQEGSERPTKTKGPGSAQRGLWASEETGGRGEGQDAECRAAARTLTFADDPVEDGLQLLDADLQVLGGKGGWHPPWGEAAPPCPEAPPPRPNLPPLPAV